jgi:hypothetical protein
MLRLGADSAQDCACDFVTMSIRQARSVVSEVRKARDKALRNIG